MDKCDKNLKPIVSEPQPNPKKPIVISSQRFKKIVDSSKEDEQTRMDRETEEELNVKEYLKVGSDALVVKFTANMPRTKQEKMDEIRSKMEMKDEMAQLSFLKSKERAEKIRRDKNEKAQQKLEKIKSGPHDLESAAMQSEVLRARNTQIKIQQSYKRAIKQQECENNAKCETISKWEEDTQENAEEQKKRSIEYKNDLMQSIQQNAKNKAEYKKQLLKEQLAERAANDLEIKLQIEKERMAMERKRAQLRKNALEAMKMVEQRRLRESMIEEVEDRVCCVFNAANLQLNSMRKIQAQELRDDVVKERAANAAIVGEMHKRVEAKEEDRIARDVAKMELKFTEEEKEKIRKDKAAKRVRIEAYLQEMKQLKLSKEREDEEKRFDMALRFKNSEVNCLFNEAEKKKRIEKVLEMRETLKNQMGEHKRAVDEMKPDFGDSTEKFDKEDEYFFDYAHDLIDDAKKKERPLYPLIKAVNAYKRHNQFDCENKIPHHLRSSISIGCRQPGDSKAAAVAEAENACLKPAQNARAAALLKCRKINELIARDTSGYSKPCPSHCPVECMQEGKQPKDHKDCDPLAPKVRYTPSYLKQLQFIAPPKTDPPAAS